MGIPAYFSSIIKRYPSIIKKYTSTIHINHLFMDCNSIIYDCFHNLSKETETKSQNEFEKLLINNVIDKLDNYLKTIGGSVVNFLAFDGVAPVAKMDQQKTRRYKSKYERGYFSSNDTGDGIQWDTSAITPGTIFMKKLERSLETHYSAKSTVVIEFSNPGEGEHKIFDYIRNKMHLQGSTVIYGLDSDLIMLSLQNLHFCESLYLYREMPEFISSMDKSLVPNDMYMVDVMDFKKYLSFYLNDEVMPKTSDDVNKRISDYIFICFLLGNDFLPHFPTVNLRRNGMDFILESYVFAIGKTGDYIINDSGDINWRVFRSMIMEMSKLESKYIADEYVYRNKQGKRYYPNKTEDERKQHFINQPIIYREKETYINPSDECWQGRYYYALFDIDSNHMSEELYNEEIKGICMNYLEGLEWTYKYYSKGCVDWRWHYKYQYPPLLNDLKKYVPYFNETLLSEKPKNPVSDVVQLSYVLPIDVDLWKAVLHTQTKNRIESAYRDFDETKNEPVFEWSYCKYFWECHVIFPNYPCVATLEKRLLTGH